MIKIYITGLLAAVLLLFVVMYQGLYSNPSRIDSIQIGKTIPEPIGLVNSFSKEKVTDRPNLTHWYLVHVWASWCDSCVRELGQLRQIVGSVPIVGIHHGGGLFEPVVESNAVFDYHWSLSDEFDYFSNPFMAQLGIISFPETFLIDDNNRIQQVHRGVLTESIWEDKFASLLK